MREPKSPARVPERHPKKEDLMRGALAWLIGIPIPIIIILYLTGVF